MVGLIGCVGLDDANDMVDAIRFVLVGNGLKYIEELLFQGKEVVIVWLANLVEASRHPMGNSFLFLGCVSLTEKHKDDGK